MATANPGAGSPPGARVSDAGATGAAPPAPPAGGGTGADAGGGTAAQRGQVRARVWWTGRSLRARLTLLATAVVALGLAAGSGLLFATLQRTQLATVDSGAAHTGQEVATMINAGLLPNPVPATVGSAIVQVIDVDGRVRAGSANADHLVPLLTPEELVRARAGERLVVSGDRVGLADDIRVVATSAGSPKDRQTVVVAVSLREVRNGLHALRDALFLGGPALLVVLGTLSWFVVGAALRPVDALRAGAEEISGTGGSRRLPVPRAHDEMHRLAATLNDMLTRLDTASTRQRQFVSDAAHELRSPLASIRTQVEVARRLGEWRDSTVDGEGSTPADHGATPGATTAAGTGTATRIPTGTPSGTDGLDAEPEESLADGVLADVDRLSRLIDDLLLLAKLDESGSLPRRREPVDLVALTGDLVSRYAEARVPVTVDCSTTPPHPATKPSPSPAAGSDGPSDPGRPARSDGPGRPSGPPGPAGTAGSARAGSAAPPAWAVGDRDGLRRAFGNLVDNAVRHAATRVTIGVHCDDPKWTVVSVSDDGPGVPAEHRERVFDRFIRLDDARDRDSGGTGLGLAIVRDLVRAHGGSVRLEDAEPGLRAVVSLPRVPTATMPPPRA